MLNIGNKIRFGHQIYNVLKIKNDDILIENNNIVNCISKEELKNNLQKISFKKPSNLTESFKLLNEKLNVSLVYENDYVKIIARPIFEGFGASIYYHGSDEKNIKEFNTKSIFWTSEIEFAKNWGKYIYKAQLDIGKCFIFNERSHFNWLLKKVGKFSYEDANGNEQYFTNYNEYIKSPLKDNNWEIVEDYTDIIKTAYNSMQVTENGTKNYAVFENKQIKLIGNATPRNLDEGYVQRKSEFANTGVMFDDDYIEFEVGMSYIDENNIKWTITDIKTDADGDQICIVESEDGRYDRISALILNIDMFDLDTKKPVFDEKYFKQEDIKKANNISEHSEIIIYTNDKKYTKIYECNKLDAIKDFTSKFNFYNALVPQYLIKNGFLEESIHHASQWKDEQGDDVFFTILKNPTRKEFNDLLKNSKHKQLRAIVGPHFNDDIYVWDAYYGTHDDIFRRYIYPVDKKFRDGFANVMFRKNDYDIWGFTFSDWFNKLGYNSKDNSTNTIPKEKWEELYADDDLGLLDESVVKDKYKNQIKLDDGQWYHQKIIDNNFGEGTFNKINVGDDIDFENKKINSNNSKELKQEYLLNDNFWKWFGNSKVVDVNGNPLICYHGSNVNIKRFDKNYCSLNTGNNEEGAFYFTSDKDAALDYSGEAEVRAKESEFYDKGIDKEKDWYAYAREIREKKLENPTINPSFLQIENPYVYDFEGGMLNHSVRHTIIATLQGNVDFNNDLFDEDLYYDIINKLETYDEENDEYIQQESFDGVIFKNVLDNCTPMGGSNNIIDEYIVWNPSQIKSVYNKGLWSPYSENVDECLNENVENKKISEEDVKEFKQHYENHKNLVNKYASKINKQYPNHDADKFSKELLIPYIKGFIWGKMNCTDEEWKSFKVAQELHYRNNAHHSQHWDKNSYFKAPDVRGKMPDEALYEMCADWCAMSEYYGNTPFEWADENIGKLWKFDEHQIQVIYDTLHKMWDSNNNLSSKHQINEMRVYAGSPTQYEKPSLIAIGSGEGNQAHGWGLYYALDRKIGEKYAKTFSVNKKTYFKGQLIKWNDTGVYLGNKKINQKDNETLYNFFANVTSYTIPDYREELNYLIKDYELSLKHWNSMGNNNSQMLENIKKRIKQKKIQLKLLDYIKQEPSYVYTCDIPENGYLYEDRTLNQQFPSIKDKLYKINNIFNLEFEDTDTGQEIYSKMVYAFETAKKASMVLLKYGIKGITYIGEQDGRCFVIFNPKDVQVLDVKRFNLNESLYFNEEVYDEYSENYIQLKVWKNPSAEWIRNTFNKTEYGAFRFVYNSQSKTLYVWDAGVAMHGAVMEYADVDGDIVGTLGDNNEVLVWPYISEDDDIDDAIEITKEKFGWFLKEIYGNIDTIKWGAND